MLVKELNARYMHKIHFPIPTEMIVVRILPVWRWGSEDQDGGSCEQRSLCPSHYPPHWQPAGPEVTCECVLWPLCEPSGVSYTPCPKEARQWDLGKDTGKTPRLAPTKLQYPFFALGFAGGSGNSYLWELQDAKKISHADCGRDPTWVSPDRSATPSSTRTIALMEARGSSWKFI